MAGTGPAPSENRRRRNEPTRGDWIEIPQVNTAKAPRMPAAPRGGWASGTKLAWKSWYADGASTMWGPGEGELVRQLAYLHHDLETMEGTHGKASLAAEIRQRCDGLGLTFKGKQDRRWRVTRDEVAEAREGRSEEGGRYGHLRVAR